MSTVNNRSNAPLSGVQNQNSASQATSIWQSALNKDANARQEGGMLNSERIETYKGKVSEDMNKFVRENPNATQEQIEKAAGESISKHAGHEMLGQMQFDYFIKKMESRGKELRADMWK